MLKNISHLGKALNKVEQKTIHGGGKTVCNSDVDCCGIGNPLYSYRCNGFVCIIGPNSTCGIG